MLLVLRGHLQTVLHSVRWRIQFVVLLCIPFHLRWGLPLKTTSRWMRILGEKCASVARVRGVLSWPSQLSRRSGEEDSVEHTQGRRNDQAHEATQQRCAVLVKQMARGQRGALMFQSEATTHPGDTLDMPRRAPQGRESGTFRLSVLKRLECVAGRSSEVSTHLAQTSHCKWTRAAGLREWSRQKAFRASKACTKLPKCIDLCSSLKIPHLLETHDMPCGRALQRPESGADEWAIREHTTVMHRLLFPVWRQKHPWKSRHAQSTKTSAIMDLLLEGQRIEKVISHTYVEVVNMTTPLYASKLVWQKETRNACSEVLHCRACFCWSVSHPVSPPKLAPV